MTQSHADARNNIFIYVLLVFISIVGLLWGRGYAFFNKLGGMEIKKDITIPPGYRRVLKNGRL